MTITRLGSNPKLAAGWDSVFGGKKASKAEASSKPAPEKKPAKKTPAKKAKGKK